MHLIESKIAVFKGTRGLSDYELFVGNFDHVEVVHFALESSANKLVSLGKSDWTDTFLPKVEISVPQRWRDGYLGASAWLIDFFAPWCPPCKAMMPEFRKMSTTLETEGLRLGTVDCVMHPQLCSDYQINSYPTQILVNGSNHPGRLSITSCFRWYQVDIL